MSLAVIRSFAAASSGSSAVPQIICRHRGGLLQLKALLPQIQRQFSQTSVLQLKRILYTEQNGVTTVEGVYIKSPREDYLIKNDIPSGGLSPTLPSSSSSATAMAVTRSNSEGQNPLSQVQVAEGSSTCTSSQGTTATACPLCRLGPAFVAKIRHTDVLILTQFMKPNGEVLPKRVTGLCARQQRRMNWLIEMARGAGLMQNTCPNFGWKKFNKYYDEKVIEDFFKHRRMRA